MREGREVELEVFMVQVREGEEVTRRNVLAAQTLLRG